MHVSRSRKKRARGMAAEHRPEERMELSEVIRTVVVNAVTGTQHSQLVPKDSVIFVPAPHPAVLLLFSD